MKPLTLKMHYFGPFINETIDFTKLDKELFLIAGPTGSGKTTIFDGMCYALYGEGSNTTRASGEMKSQFGDPLETMWVEFSFALHDKIYRIKRIPEQERKKARSEGKTRQKHEAELIRIDGDTEILLSSSVAEISNKVQEIMGINANQFRQIVMLPQGEFSRLLKAKEEERVELLKSIFRMDVYNHLREKTSKELQEIKKERDGLQQRIYAEKDHFITEEGSDFANALKSDDRNLEYLLKMAGEVVIRDETKVHDKKSEQEALEKKHDRLKREITVGEQINLSFQRQSENEQKRSELEKQKEKVQSDEECLKKSQQARQIQPIEKNWELAELKKKEAIVHFEQTQKELETVKEKKKILVGEYQKVKDASYDKEIEVIKKKIDQTQNLFNNLEDYNEKKIIEVQKFKASEALKEKVNQMIADKEKLERLEEKFRELEKKQGILEKEGWQLETDLKKYNLYQTELKNLRERFTDIETRDKEIDTLRKKWSELNDKCLESEEKYKSLLTRQKAAIAESLRADLVEGQPCPVCGGTHHPKISIENSDGVPEAELERAEKEMRSDQEKKNNLQTTGKNKREERNKRQEECIKACENIRDVNDEITDIQNVQNVCDLLDQIEIKQKNKKEEHDKNSKQIKECKVEKNKIEIEKDGLKKGIIAAKTAEDQLKNIQTEYDEFKGQMIQARSVIEKTLLTMDEKLDLKNEAINITPLKDKINKDIVLVEQKIGYKKTIELQFREVEDQQVIGETDLKNAKTRMVGDIEDAKKRKEEFEAALNEKNLDFETYSAHQNISNQALEVLEEGIKKYESECQVTEAKLKELAQVLSKQEKVDLDELNNQLKELSKSIETCRKEVLMVDQRARINRQQIQKISEKAIDLERIEKKEGLYEKLDKTIKGTLSGRPKISFERYILSAYLQDILESANLFLEQMSGNRYRLEVMEELKKGNGRGLEIEVVDAYTGLRRSANTLSGGETFMAALSMALGLSDIVQSYAGGIVLDTIFIDEGFATLDPEALDNAINCLLSIKNDGRTVGIISHVEELKERIDTKISVEKTETGSHICMNNERNRT